MNPINEINPELQELEIILKRGKYEGSIQLALMTLQLLEKFVESSCWKTAKDLMIWLDQTYYILSKASISETAAKNIILRVKKTVQEDYITRNKMNSGLEIQNQISTDNDISPDYSNMNKEIPELRSDIQTAIWELIAELETSADSIAEEAEKHIHSNEVVLTLGKSKTVETFIKKAAKGRTFEVIVAECAPSLNGHELASNLANKKIQTTLIRDSTIFAMMSRVNKVIIGSHTILANGGIKAISGCHVVALAAKYYNVPVIVLAPMYKLSPEYPKSADLKISNRLVSPESLLDYSESSLISKVQIFNPIFDYVPPELISLFIFNIGSHAPSYIYRLLHETYGQIKR